MADPPAANLPPASSRIPLVAWLLPALTLLMHLATYAGYGYFRDELYYLANGEHLGFGYVEHPPLIGRHRLARSGDAGRIALRHPLPAGGGRGAHGPADHRHRAAKWAAAATRRHWPGFRPCWRRRSSASSPCSR